MKKSVQIYYFSRLVKMQVYAFMLLWIQYWNFCTSGLYDRIHEQLLHCAATCIIATAVMAL